jgi:ELWxxDGT repeat protein
MTTTLRSLLTELPLPPRGTRLALTTLLLGWLGLAVLPSEGSAQTASLVKEFESFGYQRVYLRENTTLGEGLFFTADLPDTRKEVWYSDGTPNGTRMLADICPGECDGFRAFLGSIRNVQLWTSSFEDGGRLWRSDGTRAGTFPLTERQVIQQYPGSLIAETLPFFFGCTDESCAIWKTDGTRAGTRRFAELNIVPSDLEWLRPIGDRVVYQVDNEIWTADARGARRLEVVPGYASSPLAVWRDRVFFLVQGDDQEVWVSDGTENGTRQVTDFAAPSPFYSSSLPILVEESGIYFLADDVIHGQEVWKSDGTPQGTRRITDFGFYRPFEFVHGPSWGTEIDGKLLFVATDGLAGNRLWKTSGTPESMVQASDLSIDLGLYLAGDRALFTRFGSKGCELWSFGATGPGLLLEDSLGCSSSVLGLVERKGKVYYDVTTYSPSGDFTTWLWRTDGTRAGTARLTTIPSNTEIFDATASGRLYLVIAGEIWLWDGAEGLRQITGAWGGTSAALEDFTAFDSRLHFSADCWPGSLWQSAGTEETTSPVPGPLPSCGESRPPLVVGDSLFVVSTYWQELWRLDRSGATLQIAQTLIGAAGLVEFQGKLLFGQLDGDQQEIWSSDGTAAGTRHAFDLPAGYQLQNPLASAGGFVSLFLQDADENDEIWRSNGTAAGTSRIASLGQYGEVREVTPAGSRLFFVYDSYSSDARLWTTDGTAAGTVPLLKADGEPLIQDPRHLILAGGVLYLFGFDGEQSGFWKTDGTPQGTVLLAHFPGVKHHSIPRTPAAELGGRLFFAEDDGAHGNELWVTDGTPAGTRLFADLVPGQGSSEPRELTALDNRLFFTAHESVHGRELWISDGTAAGTRLLQDIAPEARSSTPEHLTVAGNRLYFSAEDGLLGRGLWSLLAGPSGCQPSSTRLCLNGGRFQVDVRWRDFQGGTGSGRAVPLTGDTGYFWFFDAANAEVILKVLDGRGLNDHFWVFYGALSSVEYALTVTDTQTGLTRRYVNLSGQLASVGDTTGFGPRGAFSAWPEPFVAPPSPPALVSARTEPAAATGSCQPGPRRLCVNDRRFAVEASWKDFEGKTGKGTAVPLTADTGYFWFFDAANVEVMLKVLDGTALNDKFWVFYGALSNVEYTLTVTDTQTGAVKVYSNPSGRFASVADTEAF